MNRNPMFSNVLIESVISVVPKKRIPLISFADSFGQKDIERIEKLIGIEEVSVAEEGKTASDYCCEAARLLLENRGIKASEIEALIYVTETPDYIIPGTAPIVQHELGLRQNTINLDLRCSCSGFVYGLFQASMLIESNCCENVLLLVGNTSSRLVNPKDRALLMVTGDAASAALITRSAVTKKSCFSFFVDGGSKESIIVAAGGSRMPIEKGKTDVLKYDDDGNGYTDENLKMNGMDVMSFAVKQGRALANDVMNTMSWSVQDVDLFAIHQANKLIVERIAKGLKADLEKVPISIKHTGNCGLVSIPLMLCNLFEGQNPQLGKVVACGFGSGLLAAAGAFDLRETEFIKTRSV